MCGRKKKNQYTNCQPYGGGYGGGYSQYPSYQQQTYPTYGGAGYNQYQPTYGSNPYGSYYPGY